MSIKVIFASIAFTTALFGGGYAANTMLFCNTACSKADAAATVIEAPMVESQAAEADTPCNKSDSY